MKHTFRIIAILMAALMALGMFAGCSKKKDNTEKPKDTDSVTSPDTTNGATSETAKLYVMDSDGDGTYETVVDYYGNDVSEEYAYDDDKGIVQASEGMTVMVTPENTLIYKPIEKMAFTVEKKIVNPGGTFHMEVVFFPEDATCTEYAISFENEDLINRVGENYVPKENGETNITATALAGGMTCTCQLVITNEERPSDVSSSAAEEIKNQNIASKEEEASNPKPTSPVETTSEPDETQKPVTEKPVETSRPNDTTPTQPSHTHSYTHKVVAATCTAGGYTTHTCSCGKSYTDNKTNALGHSWNDGVVTKKPTTSEEGVQTFTCNRCGGTYTVIIERLPIQQGKYDVAAQGNESLVIERIIYYINQYRTNEGKSAATRLSGKTQQFAQIRSQQIVSDFSHNTSDERAAAAQISYGIYYSRELLDSLGCPDWEPYYEPQCREAIVQGYGDTVDRVAHCLAETIYQSSGHWSYVGSNTYTHIAVGVTCSNWQWYGCLAMVRPENVSYD